MDSSEDAVAIAPDVHKVISEDHGVRILEVKLKAGAKAEMHWHPENVSYVIAGGKMKVTKQDGTSAEVELTPGQVINGVDGYHEVENIGTSNIQTIQIEYLEK